MSTSSVDQLLYRRRDAAALLAVSESQLLKWEREGILTPVDIPGIRAKRYLATDVRSLAANIAHGRLSTAAVGSE
jgi:DNA-binding transcriptional MerR regulator